MLHTFSVCAYKESPYLEKCILSLLAQSIKSNIIICTSTPNSHISSLAKKYELDLFVNEEKNGIANDWNFAYKCAKTALVTIAHQDDIYDKDYVKYVLLSKKYYKDMNLFTCASQTIKEDGQVKNGLIEDVKCMLRLPLRIFALSNIPMVKRLSISFGNPIICPSCCYDKSLCGEQLFKDRYSFVVDWEALLRLSKDNYRWICVERPLIYYRVHNLSTTKLCIDNDVRAKEELLIFERLWGRRTAKLLMLFYRKAESAYK